jgi:HAMP domain-containing protein
MKELRNYLFQTDTTQTTNAQLPWKNKTSVPKLAQLRDNLHANYFAALFPNDTFFKWEAADNDKNARDTAKLIEAYMQQKIRESNFKDVVGQALFDYIDYGNAFGEVTYETESHTPKVGDSVLKYAGPVAHRISPFDHVFDLTAATYTDATKVTRTLVSMGTLLRAQQLNPIAWGWVTEALADRLRVKNSLSNYGDADIDKSEGYLSDGFGSLSAYYSSDMIELLEMEGDLFDSEKGELMPNHRCIVMDRRKLVYSAPFESWLGRTNKVHVSWRPRPDNLMGMGPLDNLVGMQYRLDHLENLKADVFDQIAHPIVTVRGNVEDFEWGPGERIYMDEEADVNVLRPDPMALNADFQMEQLMATMEEMAGAPKQAMGIRTPGEKTAFEVQALENAAGRIFQQKITRFEQLFLEPMLNQFLEAARRNLQAAEVVKVLDDDYGVAQFMTITAETLNQKGKLYPVGARHFAQQAQTVQNLMGLFNSGVYQDPSVNTHISGKRIAEILEEQLGLEKLDLVADNIRIVEQQQTQSMLARAQEGVAEEAMNRQALDDEAEEQALEQQMV